MAYSNKVYLIYRWSNYKLHYYTQMSAVYPKEVWNALRDSGAEGTFYWGTKGEWRKRDMGYTNARIYSATFSR